MFQLAIGIMLFGKDVKPSLCTKVENQLKPTLEGSQSTRDEKYVGSANSGCVLWELDFW